jgi:hypothetical protein
MWMSDGSAGEGRVSAMVGPTEVRPGSTVVTRTIETVEEARGTPALRARLDAAVVRVELVPRYGARPRGPPHDADDVEPAAMYALTPLISLASYEVCAGVKPAAIRYLRRDPRGRIVNDAILHRISGAQ